MARIFMDGFESGSLDLWDDPATMTVNSSQTGRTGTYCCSVTSNTNGFPKKTIPSSASIYGAIKVYLPVNGNIYVYAYDGATINSTLEISSFIKVHSGNVISLKATATIPTPATAWNLIEWFHTPRADGSGRFTVKLNGITVIDYTGISATNTANITSIGLWNWSASPISYIDDLIIDDAAWVGPTSIQALVPTGAGATTQWDPSTGSNYDCVNEIPASDSDYVSTNTANEVDTYACGDLTGTINSIKTVQVQARAMQEGSPATPKLQLVVRPASTDRVSASKDVQTFTPKSVFNLWELNPEDSAAWESADVNGMEIGIKAVAS